MIAPMGPLPGFVRQRQRGFLLAGLFLLAGFFLITSPYRITVEKSSERLGGHVLPGKLRGNGPAKTKAIIASVSTKDESTSDWILDLLPGWDPVVYVPDRKPGVEAPANASRIQAIPMEINVGREASVYLTYIIDHYDALPDYMVMIHGKRYQVHHGKFLGPRISLALDLH